MNVDFEIRDNIAWITLNRPERLNAVGQGMADELEKIWLQLEADETVRAAVITGAGERAFCAGADVKESGEAGLDYWVRPWNGGFGGIALRKTLDIPVIARVNGLAFGGGFEIILGCDIVVAVEEAQFGLTEPRLGLLPLDGGMIQLQRQVPYKLAMGMLLTGRRLSAADAKEIGLINDVVPREKLDETVQGWLDDIVACAPLSVRAIKQTVQRTAHLNPQEAHGQRLPAVIRALASEDAKVGVRAFREKRKPVWGGF
ncbi:MAG TPA: enoyl-CoA hydratase-related protein [Arsenicitalea sp.]|jgi:crotonobetainyl-CoA hydratase|nr:enoyl-CoA hydratase-related protein [Arsenicitalea sp.]